MRPGAIDQFFDGELAVGVRHRCDIALAAHGRASRISGQVRRDADASNGIAVFIDDSARYLCRSKQSHIRWGACAEAQGVLRMLEDKYAAEAFEADGPLHRHSVASTAIGDNACFDRLVLLRCPEVGIPPV